MKFSSDCVNAVVHQGVTDQHKHRYFNHRPNQKVKMNKLLAVLVAGLFSVSAFAASHTGAPMATPVQATEVAKDVKADAKEAKADAKADAKVTKAKAKSMKIKAKAHAKASKAKAKARAKAAAADVKADAKEAAPK